MKISKNWLEQYLDLDGISITDYADLITTRIAEIESVYEVGTPLKDARIAEVISFEKLPGKSNANLVKVQTKDGLIDVVSNAKNLRVGMFTICLLPGQIVRKPDLTAEDESDKSNLIQVSKVVISDIESSGKFCSESELGIGPDNSLIVDFTEYNLGSKFKVGDLLSDYVGCADVIIDIDNKSLTHRPDLWSHFGFAREISAIFDRKLKINYDEIINYNKSNLTEYQKLGSSRFTNEILETGLVSRFSLLEISNVANGISPHWLRRSLFSIGAGVRNVLVDVSNYVLNDVGQPNHAFDPTLLRGNKLFARKAIEGEKFIALDDVERTLTPEDLVIADEEGPLDLAGVIGGRDFSVNSDTTEVVLVSSTFDAIAIRKTCKRHQVRTDSSSRYEKSLSPIQTILSFYSFINVLKKVGQEPKVIGFNDAPQYQEPQPIYVDYDFEEIQNRLQGVPETKSEIDSILKKLSFKIEGNKVKVPYFRATKDVSIPADLVEEVGRSIGYDRVPEIAPLISTVGSTKAPQLKIELQVLNALEAMGFSEVFNYTFSSRENLEKLGYSTDDTIDLLNSVDQNLSAVRTTLIPGMLEVGKKNLKNTEKFSVFEIGRAYHSIDNSSDGDKVQEPLERRLLATLTVSPKQSGSINDSMTESGFEFYSAVETVKRICTLLKSPDVEIVAIENSDSKTSAANFLKCKSWMHPFRAATVKVAGLACGHIAQVRPSIVDKKNSIWIVTEIDLQAVAATAKEINLFKQIPKFPHSFFEISVLVDANTYYEDVKSKIVSKIKDSSNLISLKPISVYSGSNIADGKKSISLQLVFGDPDRTLSSAELDLLRNDVMAAVERAGYSLRS